MDFHYKCEGPHTIHFTGRIGSFSIEKQYDLKKIGWETVSLALKVPNKFYITRAWIIHNPNTRKAIKTSFSVSKKLHPAFVMRAPL